jgi:hypothetical protein
MGDVLVENRTPLMALRCVFAPVSARTRCPLPSRATLVASARPAAFAKPSLVQSRRRAASRVQRRAIAPCAVSAPSSAMAMKTYTYTELSEAERDAVCARPRIDFSSIMDIVRHPPHTPAGRHMHRRVLFDTSRPLTPARVLAPAHARTCASSPRRQGFVAHGGSCRRCANGVHPLAADCA